MNILFKKEHLSQAISTVSKAISTKTTNPILECILFDAAGAEIRLVANDEELGIETLVPGEIVQGGAIAIEAKMIADIIRRTDEEEIRMETDASFKVVVTCGSAVFQLVGRDPDEFNDLPRVEKQQYVSLSQFTLREMTRQTIFSVDNSNSNKMMGGVLVEVKENILRFTTLDGHRISIRSVTLKDNYGQVKVIIPSKTLGEITKIISADHEKEIIIHFGTNQVLFSFDKTTVISRLIEGEYFKIEHMISSDYDTKLTVNKQRLLNSIEQSVIFIRENDHQPIILDISENRVHLLIRSMFGSMDADLSAVKEGNDLMIAFNPRFLIDALRAIDEEEVTLYMTNAKAPCFIRDKEENYIYLVLPVNFVV